jgi:hypothetical protein
MLTLTQTVSLTPQRDTWTGPGPTYPLTARPADAPLLLFVAGLLLCEGLDYTTDPAALTVAITAPIPAGALVQAHYWRQV